MSLVLSLFPGIGLLDMAFEEEGFCVVRGPDLLWGGDIRKFHPPAWKFDGVIGGPPCQLFSIMKRLNPRAGEKHGNLIPEFERIVDEAEPAWALMENVPGAPIPRLRWFSVQSILIRDVWVGGATSRLRRFSFGSERSQKLHVPGLALHSTQPEPAVCAGGGGRKIPVALGGTGKRKKTLEDGREVRCGLHTGKREPIEAMLKAQGLPLDFLSEAPFTLNGKVHAVGNGVPLPMGRAVAQAVKRALQGATEDAGNGRGQLVSGAPAGARSETVENKSNNPGLIR